MKVLSYIISVFLVLSSCKGSDKEKDGVVIIYNGSLQNKFELLGSKLFSFGDDCLIKEYKISDKNKISIKSPQQKIDVTYVDSHGRKRNYLLNNGDSLELNIENGVPILKSLDGNNVHLNLDNTLKNLHLGYLSPSEVFFSNFRTPYFS